MKRKVCIIVQVMEQNEVVLHYFQTQMTMENVVQHPHCSYSVLKSVHNLRDQQYEHSIEESVCESPAGLHQPISGKIC